MSSLINNIFIMNNLQSEELNTLINMLSVIPGEKAILFPINFLTKQGLKYVFPEEPLMITVAVTDNDAHILYRILDDFSVKYFLINPTIDIDIDTVIDEEECLMHGKVISYIF